MPTTNLPKPIATYVVGANAQDINAVVACFSEGAVVHDEGHTRQGIPAIRQWAEEVRKKYRPTLEVINVAEMDGKMILTCRVSGNFPGSPVELRYVFVLDRGKIAQLEIA
jgi:ketosteroid isomerase-like protein